MKSLKQSLQERQLERDMLVNDIINDLREGKDKFTKIYLAEIIVKALGEEAENVRNEMEYFINANKVSDETKAKINNAIKEGLVDPEEVETWDDVKRSNYVAHENLNQMLWDDTYDPEML